MSKEIELNGKRYRCIHPRTKGMPAYCGRWEFFYDKLDQWQEVKNYNIKIELNRLIENQ